MSQQVRSERQKLLGWVCLLVLAGHSGEAFFVWQEKNERMFKQQLLFLIVLLFCL